MKLPNRRSDTKAPIWPLFPSLAVVSLPPTSDRPGSAGAVSTLVDMNCQASWDGCGEFCWCSWRGQS